MSFSITNYMFTMSSLKRGRKAGHQWLMPVIILATQEAGIGRIMVRGQPRQIV
jgi:hypothetical protein